MSKIQEINILSDYLIKISNLIENLNQNNYLEYFNFIIEYNNNLNENNSLQNLFNIKDLFKIGIKKLEKIIDESDKIDKKEKNLIKIKQLDEILNIKGFSNDLISLCLNNQGFYLLKIDKKLNFNLAFEKFYKALELSPDFKTCITNIEIIFPFSEKLEILEPYIDKIYKYIDKFSENFIIFL